MKGKRSECPQAEMERALRARLDRLALLFPPASVGGRQVRAALACLKRGGIGNFILEYEDLRGYWRREAQTLSEVKAVALLGFLLKSAYAAAGIGPGVRVVFYPHGQRPDLGLGPCPFCQDPLDAVQGCFGCSLPLCTSCDTRQPHSPYPLCANCSPVWTWERSYALFAAFHLLPEGGRTDEQFDLLRREVSALSADELSLRGWLPAGRSDPRAGRSRS